MKILTPSPSCHRGFTLVELLVVVAVLAVLAALAFPAFSNTIRSARTSETTSNLRQIYTLFGQYEIDNQGRWPAPRDANNQLWNRDHLAPYLLRTSGTVDWTDLEDSIFVSPSAAEPGDRDNAAAPIVSNSSNRGFGMNSHLPDNSSGNYGTERQPRRNLIQEPAATMLLMDCNAQIIFGASWFQQQFTTYVENRHEGRNAILYCDGHVEMIRHVDLPLPWNAAEGTKASRFWRGI